MRYFLLFFLIPCQLLFAAKKTTKTPDEAFKALMEGNKRFMELNSSCPDRSAERRLETFEKQEPFAIILGCSDSRVAPEIIFDQGIGDLFIVRVAGNVAGAVELDSIEYALTQLKSSFVMVLGHANCGAIQAVLAGKTRDIESVAELIQQGVKTENTSPTDLIQQELAYDKGAKAELEAATKANVMHVVAQLRRSPIIKQLIEEKKLDVVGGYYNFLSGQVEVVAPYILSNFQPS